MTLPELSALTFTEWVHVALVAMFNEEQVAIITPRSLPVIVESLGVHITLRTPFTRTERFVRWLSWQLPWWLPFITRRVQRWAFNILRRKYGDVEIDLAIGSMRIGTWPCWTFEPGYTLQQFAIPIFIQDNDAPLRVTRRTHGQHVGIDVQVVLHGLAARPLLRKGT